MAYPTNICIWSTLPLPATAAKGEMLYLAADPGRGVYLAVENNTWVPITAPRGTIVMWNPLVGPVPDGWHLCDGTNGTPDMSGAFFLPHIAVTLIMKL